MPRLPLTLLALALFGACGGDARPVDSTTTRDTAPAADASCVLATLADSGAGPVRLGMRVEEVMARCPGTRDSSETQEGMPTRTLVVPVGRADTVAARIVDGRAWRLAVATPGLRTGDSLGVGTSLARLLALPGVRAVSGDGRTFVVAEQPCGLSFELDRFVQRADRDTSVLRREGRGAKVKLVLVTGCNGAP